MSRIEYGDDYEDTEQMLRACGFAANCRRHLRGKKGQEMLRELESALLALPEKKLLSGTFVVAPDADDPNGAVCAMGALVLKRKMDSGLSRADALKSIRGEAPADVLEEDNSGWGAIESTAEYVGCKMHFAIEVIEQNDEYGGNTPEERYEKVLKWVQDWLKPS